MPIATRTFRVFVSSTFEDLKEERNALQRDVFPKLRKLCEQHGARFQAIDLRWGVRDEVALDQKTMEICLREIERCQSTGLKPNFIVLLGDRYGWLPLPSRIPASELDPRPVAGYWYKLDENAVPDEYALQPRTGIFRNPDIWRVTEELLHARLESAARASGISGKALEKYAQSATHQEVVAGLGEGQANRQHVFGFFRRPSAETDSRLDAVKALMPNGVEFPAGQLDSLCEAVYERLSRVIEEQTEVFENADPLDIEIEAHNRFAAERAFIFQGRRRELDAIEDYLRNDMRQPLVLHGPSGSGKSAVMAKASLEDKGLGRILRRFVAATSDSSSGHALLSGLCREMETGKDTPVEFEALQYVFHARLAAAAPVIVYVDALDQLAEGDPARAMSWIPGELPQGVKFVISTTGEADQLPPGQPLAIEPMKVEEGGKALDNLLHQRSRTLQRWQRDHILHGFACCGLPLYLKLAAEESCLWTSDAAEEECRIGKGVAGMLNLLFERLAGPAGHGPVLVDRGLGYLAAARFGLTEDEALEVLAGDDGVWQDFDRHKHHEVEGRQLPLVVWSRLRLDLDPYLTERMSPGGMVVAFYHRQLAERAAVNQEDCHRHLARYFKKKPAWLDEGKEYPNARRSVELSYQQRRARDWIEAEATLFDAEFLLAKATTGLAQDLEADYRFLLAKRESNALRVIHEALVLSLHVLAKDGKQYASQMVGRLLGLKSEPEVKQFVEAVTTAAPRPWLRPLQPAFHPPGTQLYRTLAAHSTSVSGVAVTADGKRAVSVSFQEMTLKLWNLEAGSIVRTQFDWRGIHAVAVTADGERAVTASGNGLEVWDLITGSTSRCEAGHWNAVVGVAVTADGKIAVSASLDRTLRVWDLETGRAIRTLEGHSAVVWAVGMTADGKWAISASEDKTLKVWDIETGRAVRTMAGHSRDVFGVAVTADGKRVVSASADRTLKIWDLETGSELATLTGHVGAVRAVVVMAGGKQVISGSEDRTLKIWDLQGGRELATLIGHSGPVSAVSVTADGARVVSASWDGTLKIWDLKTRGEAHSILGHSSSVSRVAVAADGKRAVSASSDGTLKVWDPSKYGELHTLTGHTDTVHDVAVTADGKRAVSASWDRTLKIWDLETGCELRTLKGHSSSVYCVAVMADGSRAVSAAHDHRLKVWDLGTGGEIGEIICDDPSAVAMTADGKRAVSASGYFLTVSDLVSGSIIRNIFSGHSEIIFDVAMTADGNIAVSASGDKTLKVWDLETGREVRTLAGHLARVFGVAVTADGSWAVSASLDRTLRVWNLATGEVSVSVAFDGALRCCAWAHPNIVIAGDEGGCVYFFALEGQLMPITTLTPP